MNTLKKGGTKFQNQKLDITGMCRGKVKDLFAAGRTFSSCCLTRFAVLTESAEPHRRVWVGPTAWCHFSRVGMQEQRLYSSQTVIMMKMMMVVFCHIVALIITPYITVQAAVIMLFNFYMMNVFTDLL